MAERRVISYTTRRFVLAPAVVAAGRDREYLAHERDEKLAAFGVDQSIRRILPTTVSHSSANQEAAVLRNHLPLEIRNLLF